MKITLKVSLLQKSNFCQIILIMNFDLFLDFEDFLKILRAIECRNFNWKPLQNDIKPK